ncbi:2-amino-4-hydroxy-6-hydroxymethyldihydropteridine diphosphokinase, partial [Escherichia coli]
LPHPRAHERQFVLQPWLEIEPTASLPEHGSLAELADYVDGDAWRLA